MTFEVGDVVRIKATGQTASVVDHKFGVVVASHHDTHIDTFDDDEIELVENPDTIRLNYLFEPMLGIVQNIKGEYFVARVGIDYAGDYFITTVAKTPRESIDIAIRKGIR